MKPKLIIGNKNYSSWSLRPWLLLKEAGIEFDEHRIVLDVPTTQQEIASYSAAGRVPILQLGDLTVWDSLAICETVAERWPEKKLWPEDADLRAQARAISAEMHSGFAHLRDCMPMNCRAMGRKVAIPDELGEDIDRVIAIWAECHKHYDYSKVRPCRHGWLLPSVKPKLSTRTKKGNNAQSLDHPGRTAAGHGTGICGGLRAAARRL
jgi:glutathione S-transferase